MAERKIKRLATRIQTVGAVVLDAMGCGTPNCGHDHSELFLHAQCHPEAPPWARYIKADKRIVFECSICDKPVAAIAVAP